MDILSMKYTVILEDGEDGYINAHVPLLKGCHTPGKTREESLRNAREAIELYLESLKVLNRPAPEDINAVVVDA
jgi:predicted RNase H-like HicB family nuclease